MDLTLNQNKKTHQSFIKLTEVGKKFGTVSALTGVNLNLLKGEFLFICGPAGAGKTTLLKILANDTSASEGAVDRSDIFTSQVFQGLKLIPKFSCEDNIWISYDSSVHESKNKFYQEFYELCEILQFSDKLNLKIESANGGLQQKVALVRALMARPDLLLLDEPTCFLDRSAEVRVFDLLQYFNERKKLTIVWTTLHQHLIQGFTGKVLRLNQGRVVDKSMKCII